MFVVELSYFNLDQIYNSGQAPRWIQLNSSPEKSKYVIPFKDKALKIEQIRDRYDWTKFRLIMSCSEEEFFNTWFDYFDLSTDYFDLNYKIKKLGKKFKIIANRGYGVHIIRQDTFEAYVLSRLTKNLGYKDAAKIMNHIAEACGIKHVQSMREAGRITWYEFPTPQMVLDNFKNLYPMGKVSVWLKNLCQVIVNDGFDVGEHLMTTSDSDELAKLFVLHETDNFPLDGIRETLIKNFGENPEEFADWYLDDIENKGLVYMYIVHHIISKRKEEILNGFN